MRELAGPRPVRVVSALGAVWVVGFLLLPSGSLLQTICGTVPYLAASGLLLARTRRETGAVRRQLAVFAAGATVYAVAMQIWYLAYAVGAPIAFPSLLDLVFFATFACYIAFLVLVLRRRGPEHGVSGRVALVDALVLTTTASGAIWAWLLQPALARSEPGPATVTALVYPAMSLVMLFVATRLATSTGFLRRPVGWLLLVWVTAEASVDIVYGYQMTGGTFVHTSAVTVGWVVAYSAVCVLAVHPELATLLGAPAGPPPSRPVPSRLHTAGRALLLAAALTPFALAWIDGTYATVMLAAGLVSVGLLVYRSSLLSGGLREQQALTAQLDAALVQLAAQRDEFEWLAYTDPLTGLGNRARFAQGLAELRAVRGRREQGVAVLMLDLDDFKVVNDSLGHDAGDTLLRMVADRLSAAVGAAGTVARLGGDEFGVILPAAGRDAAVTVAERIVAAVGTPFEVAGRELRTAASVGVLVDAGRGRPRELLRGADLAMYEAKAAGKGRVRVFEDRLLDQARQRLELESHLWRAVERDEIDVSYQPVVDVGTGAVVRVEALARWHHPTWGSVAPSTFIPAAEQTGMIVTIGEHVLRTACEAVAALNARREQPVALAVNVSARQLQEVGFPAEVRAVLADTGLPPGLLVLELTESLAMDGGARQVAALTDLSSEGVRVSVDDFGAGHSSLLRLRALPVSDLKVDRALVAHLERDPAGRPIVAAIVAMGHALGLTVAAEGVETAGQLGVLRDLGCDLVQGELLGAPGALEGLATQVVRRPREATRPARQRRS